jgi:hypothetical protein
MVYEFGGVSTAAAPSGSGVEAEGRRTSLDAPTPSHVAKPVRAENFGRDKLELAWVDSRQVGQTEALTVNFIQPLN